MCRVHPFRVDDRQSGGLTQPTQRAIGGRQPAPEAPRTRRASPAGASDPHLSYAYTYWDGRCARDPMITDPHALVVDQRSNPEYAGLPRRDWVALVFDVTVTSFSLALTVAFVCLMVALAYSTGVCCVDDGLYAQVAKNLAEGRGYASSLLLDSPAYKLTAFHTRVGAGPTLVFPVAIGIWLFGNAPWVPGVCTILVWCSVVLMAFWLLRGSAPTARVASAVFCFVCVGFSLTLFHIEQWHSMLGEIPAAVLVFLSYVVFARAHFERRTIIIAGLTMGLACQSKLLAGIYVVPLGIALFVIRRQEGHLGAAGWGSAWLFGAMTVPLVGFELWKMMSLGPAAYLVNFKETIAFVFEQGVGPDSTGLAGRLAAASETFADRFGVSVVQIIVVLAICSVVLWRCGRTEVRTLGLSLVGAVAIGMLYWFFLSNGWPRYFIIGIALLSALVGVSSLALAGRRWQALWLAAVLIWSLQNWPRIGFPASLMDRGWFVRNSRLEHALRVKGLLDTHSPGTPIWTQWWGMATEMEYLSASAGLFQGFRAMSPPEPPAGSWIVVDSRLLDKRDRDFGELIASCRPPVLDLEPYAVYICEHRQPR